MNQIQFLCRWHKSLAHPLQGTYSALSLYDEHVTIQTVVSQLHKTFASSVFMVVRSHIRMCVHKLHWSFNKKNHITFCLETVLFHVDIILSAEMRMSCGLLLWEAQFRDMFSWGGGCRLVRIWFCTTPSSSDKTAIKTWKKNVTHIYVKDHKATFIILVSYFFKKRNYHRKSSLGADVKVRMNLNLHYHLCSFVFVNFSFLMSRA